MNYAGNHRSSKIVIVTLFFHRSVPQLKFTTFLSSLLERPLCCLAFITFFFVQFSRYKLQPLLKPDLKIHPQNGTLVGPSGLEPPTLRLSVVRSSQLSYGPMRRYSLGGDSRDRTGDLLLARQALSQLSYIPRPSSGYVYPLN